MFPRFDRLAAVAFLVAALFTTSCSTTLAPPATSTSPETTKPYGSLTIVTNFGGSIDPMRDSSVGYSTIGAAVIDSLTYRDINYELKPGLAEWWELAPDGMSQTFYIRKGVKFHDGSDLTSADVKFSIERLTSPKSIETEASIWRAAIASIELKDDYTVVMRMKSPQFEVLKSQHDAMAAIVPKKYIEEKGDDYFASHPIGSGPWKVLEYQPGIRLELEAVEDHWRARPRFQRLTVLNVPELSTKIAMLKTGEVDMAGVSPDSIPNLEASGLRILSYWSGGGYYGYPLYDVENPQKYAFGDVRVRKAMQLAVNSKELADKLFRGRASPVTMATNYVEVDAKANAFDPNLLKPDPYDAEGAKKLLAEAGYPDGFNTRIYDVGAGDMRSTLSLALGGYWRKIGVNAEIVPIEYGAFFPKMQSRSPETWNSYYVWVTSGAKTWQRMFTYFHSTKSNPKNNKNPKLDSLLDSIAGTRDPVERERLQLEAAVLSKNDYSLTSVLGTHNILALGKKLGDVGQKPYVYEISGIMFETITHAK